MTTLKPEFDLLLTYHRRVMNHRMMGYLKGGAMYRSLTFDRASVNDLHRINFEVQVGLSQKIAENMLISIGYQGVISSGLGLQTSSITNTGTIKNIPSQHGILLSVSYSA